MRAAELGSLYAEGTARPTRAQGWHSGLRRGGWQPARHAGPQAVGLHGDSRSRHSYSHWEVLAVRRVGRWAGVPSSSPGSHWGRRGLLT